MAISYDNENYTSTSSTNTHSVALVGANTASVLVNAYYIANVPGVTVTQAQYGGQNLTVLRTISRAGGPSQIYAAQFGGVGLCTGSSLNASITLSATVLSLGINPQSWLGVASFSDVNVGATGTSTSPSTSSITLATGEVAVDAMIYYDSAGTFTNSSPNTNPAHPANLLIGTSNVGAGARAASHLQRDVASVSMTWSISTSTDWAQVATVMQPLPVTEVPWSYSFPRLPMRQFVPPSYMGS